uniref:Uncharacterized protein n=1 Tax=Timema shepardi TaxID=629360 RepID=A0A7R9AP50_TIMSH|nr:unnamed protein product [Timema shepardi]
MDNATQISSTGRQANLSTLSITFLSIDRLIGQYFSSHPPVYEKDTKIFVWNCALHSASDVVFDCCVHTHIGEVWGVRRDCQVEIALLLSQCRLWRDGGRKGRHTVDNELCSSSEMQSRQLTLNGRVVYTLISLETRLPMTGRLRLESRSGVLSPAMSDHVLGPRWRFWRRRRDVLVVLTFLGFVDVILLRMSRKYFYCEALENSKDTTFQGSLLSWLTTDHGTSSNAFLYGYLLTVIPGGFLATKIGGQRLYGIRAVISVVVTLIIWASNTVNSQFILAIMFLEGLCWGLVDPSIMCIWSQWFPLSERNRLIYFSMCGVPVGHIMAYVLVDAGRDCCKTELTGINETKNVIMSKIKHTGSVLSEVTSRGCLSSCLMDDIQPREVWMSNNEMGLVNIILFQILGTGWSLVWWLTVKDRPREDPNISPEELHHIEKYLTKDGTNGPNERWYVEAASRSLPPQHTPF